MIYKPYEYTFTIQNILTIIRYVQYLQEQGFSLNLLASLERNSSNCSYIFLLDVNFENLTDLLRVLNVLNINVKFHSNRMIFTIQVVNLFLCIILDHKNLKFKYLIDNIIIDSLSFLNFASLENIIRK